MLKLLTLGTLLLSALLPTTVYAAPQSFRGFVTLLLDIINNAIVPLLFALAFIVFVWGTFRYFIADSSKAKDEGRNILVWGLLAIVVMASVWGLVLIVVRTLFP